VNISRIYSDLKQLKTKFEKSLGHIFYPDTVQEWSGVYLDPKIRKMSEIVELGRNQDQVLGGLKPPDMQT